MPDVRLRITGKNVSKKALSDLRSDIAKTNKSLQESKDNVEDLREETEKFKEGLTGIGVVAGVAFTALSAVVIKATRDYARFAHEISMVSTMIREDVTRNTAILSKGIREIARTVPQSVSILNTAMYDLLSASVPVNISLTMLRQSGKAAVAGVSQVNVAANLATGTINALGMAFTEADKVFDVAFSTVRAGKVTFTELASAMGQVLPAAAKMGSTIDEVYGSIAFLTKNAMDAAMASVSFARALDGLGEKAAKLKDMGVRVFGEKGEYLGILNIMGQIAKQMEGLTEEARVNLMKEMGFDIRAARAITVMSTNLDAFRKTMDEVTDSAGATEEAFDKMKDTLVNSWVILKNNLRDLSIVMGETFGAPALAMINTLVDALQRLSDTQKQMVAWGTVVGVAISGVITAATGFVLLKPRLLAMAAAFAKVSIALAPFAAAAVAAGLAIAGMAWALNEYKKARKDVFTEDALAATASNIRGVRNAVEEWGQKVKGLSKVIDEARGRGADLAEEYSEQTERLKYYKRMMAEAIIELRKLRGDTFGAAVATRDLRRGLISIDDILDEYAEGLTGAAKATGDATEGTKDYKAVIEAIFDPINALTKALGLQDLIWLQVWEDMEAVSKLQELSRANLANLSADMETFYSEQRNRVGLQALYEAEKAWEAASERKKAIAAIEEEYERLTSREKELLDKQWAAEEKRLKDLEVGEEALQRARFNHYKEFNDKLAELEDERLEAKDKFYNELNEKDRDYIDELKERRLDFAGYTSALEKEMAEEGARAWDSVTEAFLKTVKDVEKGWDDITGAVEESYDIMMDAGLTAADRLSILLGDFVAGFDVSMKDLRNIFKMMIAEMVTDWISGHVRMAAATLLYGLKDISVYTAKAAAAAYSAIAGIPVVGPILAPIAAVATVAGVGAIIADIIEMKEGGILPGQIAEAYKLAQPARMVSAAAGGIFNDPTLALIGEGGGTEAVVPLTGNRKIPVELRGSAGDINIDKIEIVLPEGYLENMDQATFNRIFMKRMLPAIHNAKRAGLINEAFL